jgi:flagellar biosynthetic protein FliR
VLSVTSAQLHAWVATFLWPLFRLLALFSVAPLFSEAGVPRRVKVGLAALIAMLVGPGIANLPVVPVYSFEGLMIIVNEIAIGIAMGFIMRLVFAAVQYAGETIGLQMGLSFASFFDRNSGGQTVVLASFLNLVAMLLFLSVDGHLMMLATLVQSFDALPIGATPLSPDGFRMVAYAGATVFSSGLLLALPVVAAVLILNLAMGILNRASPQLSIFAVGFPVTLSAGILLMTLTMPQMGAYISYLLQNALTTLGDLVAALAR